VKDWNPEDEVFWANTGSRVARRNLIWSIVTEHLGFSVWLLWSVIVLALPKAGFDFSVDQLFWLVAVPNLVGAAMRIPYTFAVPKFGGRNWTVISALLLLIPTAFLTYCVTSHASYGMFVLAAATAGLGGGNFASSMANISFFYPERRKGFALGLNAAGGNIGVAVVQVVVPIVIVAGGLAFASLMWMPLVVIAAICAWLFMDNLTVAKSSLRSQLGALKRKHTWVMSFLYIGTFGSFIGYSAAMPLLMKTQFPEVAVAKYAFLGALVGSFARPVGGWLADRIGGARVTLGVFAGMGIGVLVVLHSLATHNFGLFLGSFVGLFIMAGAGNGSTYRMIPAIFRAQARSSDAAKREGAAVLGIASSIGAFGGFFIPRSFGNSIAATGSVDTAFYGFLGFYAIAFVVTYWFYERKAFTSKVPSLSYARV
jgi:NNP family nitrate/nitrite transporter-like MFS transporter